MAGRLWRWSFPSGVLLVSLGFGRPGSAQAVHPFEPETGLERTGALESGKFTFEGIVYDQNGAPAEGAVVVSSAGGQAVTGWDGTYRLEVRVPLEADRVQITAVGRTGENLLASQPVALPAASGPVDVSPLHLAQGGTCSPSWLPTFGGHPGVADNGGPGNVRALAVFDDGGGPALYVGGYFKTAGGVAASGIAKWDGSSWAAFSSGLNGPV